MNNSGKALTVFLIVIAILLISLTAIAAFFFLKEVEVRKALEYNIEQLQLKETKLQESLNEAKNEIFLLEEQKKESGEEIESLQGELDLAQGLREEIKKENRKLIDDLDVEKKAKQALEEKMESDLSKTQEKIDALQQEIKSAVSRNKELDAQRQELKGKYQLLLKQIEGLGEVPASEQQEEVVEEAEGVVGMQEETFGTVEETEEEMKENVELGKIVVSPTQEKQGKIISIDKETDFVIVNLGEEDGVKKGAVLSIYRGDNYLGDVKVSRVLPEMSAADFVPPLKSHKIKKNDQVVIKK